MTAWFGGKSRCAAEVWQRFGDVPNYVESFFGSGAVLLGRPTSPGIETINDLDGFVSNFWRALKADPEALAYHADWPANENDLHARHAWLKVRRKELSARLEGNPDYYDVKIAGWWVWGLSLWIGGGFCGDSGSGPWVIEEGRLIYRKGAQGVKRDMPSMNSGRGVSRRRLHLNRGVGVSRQMLHLGSAGKGISGQSDILRWFTELSDRLRRVRVCCGDWQRILGPSPTTKLGMTAVFLDPPYGNEANRDMNIYSEDSGSVAREVRYWAVENGENPLLRIALCGYDGEHEMPETWECFTWKARGGYASQGNGPGQDNKYRERIWFSPACLRGDQKAFDFRESEHETAQSSV